MFSPQCLVCSIPCILMFRQPTARREVRKNNDCAESELANHLSPKSGRFPSLYVRGAPQTFYEMVYAYIHAIHL